MSSTPRVAYDRVEGADELFTEPFLAYLLALNDVFATRVHDLRKARAMVLQQALRAGKRPGPRPPGPATTASWSVPVMPPELRRPGIEISGPASITPMFINAVNPGPDGVRAEGDLDDDEDSAGHRLADTLLAASNRLGAVERTLSYSDEARGRKYSVQPGDLPFFMHRERGLMLDEPDFQIDGRPVPAALLGTALTLFHAGRAQAAQGQGIYFYLPKLESPEEVALYRDMFALSQDRVPYLKHATVRAIILVESLPAVWQMEEMLHALGPYAAGLNAARWDLKASILEYVMADPGSVWPDRFGVDIKKTEFLGNIFRRLVAVCLKHEAVPIGGMATALPHRDQDVNREAAAAIRADKDWEARQGFLRAWVAHIYHMGPAAAPFKELAASGWTPTAHMRDPANFPVAIATPSGQLTYEGTRQNARTLIEYVEGWMTGRGAKGIDRLAGRPGKRPALMEDLATARISVAQIAQRVIHASVAQDTEQKHDLTLVKKLLVSEGEDIIARLGADAGAAQVERYRRSVKIAMKWVRNYVELDFRSLGSYSRPQLEAISEAPDAI
jgi:malate synthase